MGTFGMSISGFKGSFGTKHLGPSTTILGVDPFPRNGIARVVLTFDHQVIDGTPATKTLQNLNQMLNTAIRKELAELIGVNAETGEKLSEEEQRFKSGRSNSKTVIDYQNDLLLSQLNAAKALTVYRKSLIDLQVAQGVFLRRQLGME